MDAVELAEVWNTAEARSWWDRFDKERGASQATDKNGAPSRKTVTVMTREL